MKRNYFLLIFSSIFIFSCSKSGTDTPAAAAEKFMSYSSGSTWNYQQVNNTPPTSTSLYTVTSTNRDSTINGKTYHVFTNSTSGSEYYFNSNGDYYIYRSPLGALGGAREEFLYLKDNIAINTTWAQNYTVNPPIVPFPITVTVTNKIKEKGMTKIVSGTTYNDVIQVETSLSTPGITIVSDIQSYYAPKKGLIENKSIVTVSALGASSNTQTNLLSSTIL